VNVKPQNNFGELMRQKREAAAQQAANETKEKPVKDWTDAELKTELTRLDRELREISEEAVRVGREELDEANARRSGGRVWTFARKKRKPGSYS
jgi:hypothetical protein